VRICRPTFAWPPLLSPAARAVKRPPNGRHLTT
jgi:hypothetical protein